MRFLVLCCLAALLGAASCTCLCAQSAPAPALVWTDVRALGVEGQGWCDTRAPFDRLPAKAEGVVRSAVWELSRHSAGLCVRFVTDGSEIHARWVLTSSRLAMPHMAATGVSGVDLYVKTERGRWRWLAVGRPERQTNAVRLVGELPPGRREYLLYLPLYNGTHWAELGVPGGAVLAKAGPWGPGSRRPMVFYGTSIQQGGCASRPGMVHSAILGRRFQFPHINLGFSGNGRMESELAGLLAELDPSVFILDCLPNMQAAEVAERVEPFVRRLRVARPTTPMVLVEDRSYADAFLIASKRGRNEANRVALRRAFQHLKQSGVRHLVYVEGDGLLGDDGEGTVDSSHPTDLGFMRQADALGKVLEPLLRRHQRLASGPKRAL
ncbi:MAG: SGNH/GDSL hydrolase family protein [Verrucomicrobia bacterium]|nr:SGNH/GDSL hydrolase family protein [Verrucomicrobiota bacterium]